jgi:hypothetical protein
MNVTLLFGYRRFSGHAVHPGRRPRPRLGAKRNTVQKAAGTLRVPSADLQKLGFIRIATQGMCVRLSFV